MKFGLKLWSSDTNLINEAKRLIDKKVFDYVELTVVPNTHISPFKIDVPYVIHCPHEHFGVNPGDSNKKKYTIQKINESLKWIDMLNAKYLIIHPGYGSIKNAKEVMDTLTNKHILIENMPKVGLNNEQMIGYSSAEINELSKKNQLGFCLDLGHAIKAAISLKKNYKDHIKDLIRLKPEVFHVCDGLRSNEKDEHLNINEGNYDFNFLSTIIKKNSSKFITLETPRHNKESLNEDIKNIEKLKYFLR